MAVSISLAGGGDVVVFQLPQGGVAFDALDGSLAPLSLGEEVAAGPAAWVDARPLADGGFSVEWRSGGRLLARDYSASGQATDAAHAYAGFTGFAPVGFASGADGAEAWLANGDRVVSSQSSDGGRDYQVHVQLQSPQGAPIGPAFAETAPPVSLFTAPVIAPLADGSYEAAWAQQGNYSSQLLIEHFTSQGVATGQATAAVYGGFDVIGSSGYAIAGLADGGFAAAWTVQDGPNGGSPQVYAEEFTAAGAPVGSATHLGSAASTSPAPVIDALSDGHFVVSWTSPAGPAHQVLMDPAPPPPPAVGLLQSGQLGADVGAAVGAAASSGAHWAAGAASALHPLASLEASLAQFGHAQAGSQHFGFL